MNVEVEQSALQTLEGPLDAGCFELTQPDRGSSDLSVVSGPLVLSPVAVEPVASEPVALEPIPAEANEIERMVQAIGCSPASSDRDGRSLDRDSQVSYWREDALDDVVSLARTVLGLPMVQVRLSLDERIICRSQYGFSEVQGQQIEIWQAALLEGLQQLIAQTADLDRAATDPNSLLLQVVNPYDDWGWRSENGDLDIRFLATLPLIRDGICVGWLTLGDRSAHQVQDYERLVLQALVNMALVQFDAQVATRQLCHTEQSLRLLTEGVSVATGLDFCRSLVLYLAQLFQSDCAFISQQMPGDQLRTIALCHDGQLQEPQVYPLAQSPCDETLNRNEICYFDQLRQQFPAVLDCIHSWELNYYLGMPLLNAQGKRMGVLGIMYRQSIAQYDLAVTTLKLFAPRVSAELERYQIQKDLFREKELAQITLQSIQEAVITTDAKSRIQSMNQSAEQLLGYSFAAVQGLSAQGVLQLQDETTSTPLGDLVQAVLTRKTVLKVADRAALINAKGQTVSVDCSAAPLLDSQEMVIGAVLILRDVTQSRQASRQLSWQASHDGLTGLPNRRAFERRLIGALQSAWRNGEEHVLCYLDLDFFKIVNDSCGHLAGDKLLTQISLAMQDYARKVDFLARLGGDEFALLLQQCPLDRGIAIAQELCSGLREFPFIWQGKTFRVGVSVGVVAINAETPNLSTLLNWADTACYRAKNQGRGVVHLYEPNDNQDRALDEPMITQINKAIEQDRFQLYCQPIVPLNPIGQGWNCHEVLIRMINELGQVVAPGVFLSEAERYNLMPTIDRWVVRNLFRILSQKPPTDPNQHPNQRPNLYTVNLSGASLNDSSFPAFLRKQFELFPVLPSEICFEVTETVAVSNIDQLVQMIREFKAIGCYFALDDFGSGMSSFGYLKSLPVDILKIDGSLVLGIAEDSKTRAIVEAIHHLGHLLNIQTVAEFVENDQILAILQRIGINYAQGYGVGKPRPLIES
jgi:diguanylate cyclase (GGDEF)-like protein/PAS domain S-box-containing protein